MPRAESCGRSARYRAAVVSTRLLACLLEVVLL
jgi:hypothetical protein